MGPTSLNRRIRAGVSLALTIFLSPAFVDAGEDGADASAPQRLALANGAAEVVVDPAIGRIVSWRLAGGENVLWVNPGELASPYVPGWKNHGGDKLWITPQLLRPFAHGTAAPDPDLDGKPWTVISQNERGLVMRSPESQAQGVVLTRALTLDETAARLTIVNRVTRTKPSPLGVQLWTVTQTRRPLHADMFLRADWYPQRARHWQSRARAPLAATERVGEILRIRFPETGWDKIGGWSGRLAAVFADSRFIQTFEPPAAGCYPENATAQVYGNAEYIELEAYGSYRHLAPGEWDELTVYWTLESVANASAAISDAPSRGARARERGGRGRSG